MPNSDRTLRGSPLSDRHYGKAVVLGGVTLLAASTTAFAAQGSADAAAQAQAAPFSLGKVFTFVFE